MSRVAPCIGIAALALAYYWEKASWAETGCLKYTHSTTALEGQLDRAWTHGIAIDLDDPLLQSMAPIETFDLTLTKPLCELPDDIDDTRQQVDRVQIVHDSKGFDALSPYYKNKVKVRGTLSPGVALLHHSEVILSFEAVVSEDSGQQ